MSANKKTIISHATNLHQGEFHNYYIYYESVSECWVSSIHVSTGVIDLHYTPGREIMTLHHSGKTYPDPCYTIMTYQTKTSVIAMATEIY